LARVRSEESRLAWALVGCALHGRCDDRVVEGYGNLLEALGGYRPLSGISLRSGSTVLCTGS